jgi:enoyl-CoA hydratase/carnithine racemase
MSYETLLYEAREGVATITLNRPEQLNTIVPPMPDEIEAAIEAATDDTDVRVIVLRGAGRAFCAGYDFSGGGTGWDEEGSDPRDWDAGHDFAMVTQPQTGPTPKMMSIWTTLKPVIAQVHGWCVGGGSDMALCADLVIASEDAVIGTPYARMWGTYLSGMWIYRLGLTKVKELALTGAPLTGTEAVEIGLINHAVPFDRLEQTVADQARQIASLPPSQTAAMKLVVNQAFDNMGLATTRTIGGILDGLMRHTPEAHRWLDLIREQGARAGIEQRDGPFGDYSQAPPERRPNPDNVIDPNS